jgi:hypothetical protein
MSENNIYLHQKIQQYTPRDLINYSLDIFWLKAKLKIWANGCYINLIDSGSRAKGTAIAIASDVDYLISLSNNCHDNMGGLQSIYNSLYNSLCNDYTNVRKQNVSVRINLKGLEIDITPAKKQAGNTNAHSLWVSKLNTWKKTNVHQHITDVFNSGRKDEIKLLKIWRELNKLDFPSIYLLINNILFNKASGLNNLATNFWHTLLELAKEVSNPLFDTVSDPANTNNILSDLLTNVEKNRIIAKAKIATTYPANQSWGNIIW